MKADYAIVCTNKRGDNHLNRYIVKLKSEGIHFSGCEQKLGWRSLESSQVNIVNVKVKDTYCLDLDENNDTIIEVEGWQDTIKALLCVQLGEKALYVAKRYSKERIQFGQPISNFQVLRHKMADMAIAIEKARSISYRSLYLLEEGDRSTTFHAIKRNALKNAIEMVNDVTDSALQIHGGAGYMMEFPVQRLWRDAKMFSVSQRDQLRDNSHLINWLNEEARRQVVKGVTSV